MLFLAAWEARWAGGNREKKGCKERMIPFRNRMVYYKFWFQKAHSHKTPLKGSSLTGDEWCVEALLNQAADLSRIAAEYIFVAQKLQAEYLIYPLFWACACFWSFSSITEDNSSAHHEALRAEWQNLQTVLLSPECHWQKKCHRIIKDDSNTAVKISLISSSLLWFFFCQVK